MTARQASTDGSKPAKPTRAEFVAALWSALKDMNAPAKLAKVFTQIPTDEAPKLEPMLILQDDWMSLKPDCVKFYAVIAYCPDLIEMHHYKTHDAIGIETDIPVDWIKAFKWATEEETKKFFDIHQYKDAN